MQLHAAILPPPTVVEDLVRTVGNVRTSPESMPARRRPFGIRRRTDRGEAPAPPPLDLLAPAWVMLPLTAFGNVTASDARRLSRALVEVCAGLERPMVRLDGGEALEPIGDDAVWARVQSDDDSTASLSTIARSVVQGVERVGFFCDRRVFAPRIRLATINEHTTETDLEAALVALASLACEPWEVTHVSLLQRSVDTLRLPSEEIERIPLGR